MLVADMVLRGMVCLVFGVLVMIPMLHRGQRGVGHGGERKYAEQAARHQGQKYLFHTPTTLL
jgi:RNA-splicing ligase RtcB